MCVCVCMCIYTYFFLIKFGKFWPLLFEIFLLPFLSFPFRTLIILELSQVSRDLEVKFIPPVPPEFSLFSEFYHQNFHFGMTEQKVSKFCPNKTGQNSQKHPFQYNQKHATN